MQEAVLTDWINSQGTQLLLVYLRRRKAETLKTFLQGQPVDPVHQGRAAALHELETLLLLPADDVKKVFEAALKEQKT